MKLPQTPKIGKVIPHGVKPAPHEWDTILFFTNLGKDVELIVPSNTPHSRKPDYIIDGLAWEAKSPTKCHHRTIERVFYDASNQSPNIIIDLRRAKGKENAALTLEKCFKHTRKVRNLYIITKNNVLKECKK